MQIKGGMKNKQKNSADENFLLVTQILVFFYFFLEDTVDPARTESQWALAMHV